ncbi:hypothetical protein [Sphingomonas sp. GB1N7]
MTAKLSYLWTFRNHRPAIGIGVLVLMMTLQSVVAYGRDMFY